MIGSARAVVSRWGLAYLSQLLGGRFRLPAPDAHLILVVANHFEPGWNERSHRAAVAIEREWCDRFAALGVVDGDGHPFKHTYFFPAEQAHPELLEPLAEHCAAGFGEVEVHLHHGLDRPDTPAALERDLERFVETLVGHRCLARDRETGRVGYAFVHGNWALANSAGGRNCGVDGEMAILASTGCYADLTLPSAPDPAQVAVVNAIYECARPLEERAPHRAARHLAVGGGPVRLPLLLQGPLLLDWSRRLHGIPVPRLENADLGAEFPPSIHRLRLWASANVHVAGQPEWVFVKLHTHGLIERHLDTLLGEPMRGFLEDATRWGFRLHFATAREAVNMILAAVDGRSGDPGRFRDYRFVPLGRPAAGRIPLEGKRTA
ncbi:MAG: hypothetical protein L0027_11470 [Candidatus Rokubacteria bacterium]|nr:hypothetical protein [Candidatus Rokubacteria bacterium]